MGSARASTLGALLLAAAVLAVSPVALALLPRHGVTLVLEGWGLMLDGGELCRDIDGVVAVRFGDEFRLVDLCGPARRGALELGPARAGLAWWSAWMDLSGGARYWAERLKALRGRGYGGVTLPTVSVTFWLVGDGVHYIANYAVTSIDYHMGRLGDYGDLDAFVRALVRAREDPMAVVRERMTIVVRPGDLAERLVAVNLTRALEVLRRELGLPELPGSGLPTPCRGPGAVCPLRNYWGLPEAPQEWFARRVKVGAGPDRDAVVAELWRRFVDLYSTAYLLDKSAFPTLSSAWGYLTRASGSPCRRLVGVPIDMGYVVGECLRPESLPRGSVGWEHSTPPGARLTLYKPFVAELAGERSPLDFKITYLPGTRKFGLSLAGAIIYGSVGDGGGVGIARLRACDWEFRARAAAIVVPAYAEYLYDAALLTWNLRTVELGGRDYWLAEPVPVVLPYFEETDWAPDTVYSERWRYRTLCYDEALACLKEACPPYGASLGELLRNAAGTLPLGHRPLKLWEAVRGGLPSVERVYELRSGGAKPAGVLGAVLLGIPGELLGRLFPGGAPPPFDRLLGLLEYSDATFGGLEPLLRLELELYWRAGYEGIVTVWVATKDPRLLSDDYARLGRLPVVPRFVVEARGSPPRGG